MLSWLPPSMSRTPPVNGAFGFLFSRLQTRLLSAFVHPGASLGLSLRTWDCWLVRQANLQTRI